MLCFTCQQSVRRTCIVCAAGRSQLFGRSVIPGRSLIAVAVGACFRLRLGLVAVELPCE